MNELIVSNIFNRESQTEVMDKFLAWTKEIKTIGEEYMDWGGWDVLFVISL